jgi:hypothetical protein
MVGEIGAQSIAGSRAGVNQPVIADSSAPVVSELIPLGSGKRVALRPYAGLASLIAPGSGQFLLGKDRFIGFLAVEMLGWWQYSKDVRERAAQERAYKDYARRVARAPFASAVPDGKLPDGTWEYYEQVRDWPESGQFSLATSGPTVPEKDTTTFNGKRWEILQSTTPTFEAALAAYEREAIRPEFRWSWLNAQLSYDIYIRTTDLQNDAARAALKDLIVIGANHFLSMIDAFAAFRLQVRAEGQGRTSVGAAMRW